jgi:hypothetical protein
MRFMSQVFVKRINPEMIQRSLLFPFLLSFSKARKTIFYTLDLVEQNDWIREIEKATNYTEFLRFYELGVKCINRIKLKNPRILQST